MIKRVVQPSTLGRRLASTGCGVSFVCAWMGRVLLTKASHSGRGGSRKADGEGAHDGFWIVTFDYVNKQFAVHQAFSSGRRGTACGG